MSKPKELPIVDRPCPKCNAPKAYGPEYRRGVKNDEGLGEHLRFYCTVCRYMTAEPTCDQDTPERRAELTRLFEERKSRQLPPPESQPPSEARQRDIENVRRSDVRRPYGWNR